MQEEAMQAQEETVIRYVNGGVKVFENGEPVELDEATVKSLLALRGRKGGTATDGEAVFSMQSAIYDGSDPQEKFEPWENQLYGALVMNERKKRGFSTAQAFSDAIYRRTRVRIGRDTLYKIEQGRQTPDIRQFFAINIALYHNPFAPKVTTPCICSEWMNIATNEGEIPMSWRKGNTLDLEEATGDKYSTGIEAARAANDDPKLFTYGSAEAI